MAANMLTSADEFKVQFTPEMPWTHRALLMSTFLFIDFQMFEEKPNTEQHRTNVHTSNHYIYNPNRLVI